MQFKVNINLNFTSISQEKQPLTYKPILCCQPHDTANCT